MISSQTQPTQEESNRKALEAFVVNNEELERLEALLSEFNIFEAIGAVRQELRHSDFLAYLLDPRQNHGLGDAFVKRLLQNVLISLNARSNTPVLDSIPLTLIDIDIWDFDDINVEREWENIDILLRDETHKLAIIIENKIDSSEQPGQLQRYYEAVQKHYGGWKILGLYLTPDGEPPSDSRYVTADYEVVYKAVKTLEETRASTMGADVRMSVHHYSQMLRRHIVSKSDIAQLCRSIYTKHKRALDLIYEYRPDQQLELREFLEALIQETAELDLDHCIKTYIRFAPKEWNTPVLRAGTGWTPSGAVLLFEFVNRPDNLKLNLVLGPGPQQTRATLFDFAQLRKDVFHAPSKGLNKGWNALFSRQILTSDNYVDTKEELDAKVKERWERFLKDDLPIISAAIRSETWIWKSTNS